MSQIIGINWSSPTTQILGLVIGGYLAWRFVPQILPGKSVIQNETQQKSSSLIGEHEAEQRAAKVSVIGSIEHLLLGE